MIIPDIHKFPRRQRSANHRGNVASALPLLCRRRIKPLNYPVVSSVGKREHGRHPIWLEGVCQGHRESVRAHEKRTGRDNIPSLDNLLQHIRFNLGADGNSELVSELTARLIPTLL